MAIKAITCFGKIEDMLDCGFPQITLNFIGVGNTEKEKSVRKKIISNNLFNNDDSDLEVLTGDSNDQVLVERDWEKACINYYFLQNEVNIFKNKNDCINLFMNDYLEGEHLVLNFENLVLSDNINDGTMVVSILTHVVGVGSIFSIDYNGDVLYFTEVNIKDCVFSLSKFDVFEYAEILNLNMENVKFRHEGGKKYVGKGDYVGFPCFFSHAGISRINLKNVDFSTIYIYGDGRISDMMYQSMFEDTTCDDLVFDNVKFDNNMIKSDKFTLFAADNKIRNVIYKNMDSAIKKKLENVFRKGSALHSLKNSYES